MDEKESPEEKPLQLVIEEALRALPLKDLPARGIPYRLLIPAIAHRVMAMRLPHKQLAIRKRAASDLSKVTIAAVRLGKLIDDHLSYSPVPSAKARASVLLGVGETILVNDLSALLEQFIRAMRIADVRNSVASSKGAPLKGEADAIAQLLYVEYERLTGERPKRTVRNGKSSGHFQTLIAEVFRTLRIKASAEATSARVMKKMKKKVGA